MKSLVVFLLLIPVASSYSQALHKMQMNVRESGSNRIVECHNDTTVIWGVNDDSLCFQFKAKNRCYFPITKDVEERVGKEKLQLFHNTIISYGRLKDQMYILQDARKEVYMIRITQMDSTIQISIINMEHGFPNYQMGFNCNRCK